MMRWSPAILLTLVVALIGGGNGANATTIIDTTTSPTTNGFGAISDSGTTTFGEIFTVSGPDTFLTNFSLYLIDKPSGGCICGSLDFIGYIGAWDGQKVSQILYTSRFKLSRQMERWLIFNSSSVRTSSSQTVNTSHSSAPQVLAFKVDSGSSCPSAMSFWTEDLPLLVSWASQLARRFLARLLRPIGIVCFVTSLLTFGSRQALPSLSPRHLHFHSSPPALA
jgi:hypothetical protein